jgi:hypothetical protein
MCTVGSAQYHDNIEQTERTDSVPELTEFFSIVEFLLTVYRVELFSVCHAAEFAPTVYCLPTGQYLIIRLP